MILKAENLSNIDSVNHGFCDRHGGRSLGDFSSLNFSWTCGDDFGKVLKNRGIVARRFGAALSETVVLHQCHGDVVHIVNSGNLEEYKSSSPELSIQNEGDALITNLPGILVGVQTADCAPILLCDQKVNFVSAIHAGWRGTVGKIIENTVSTLTKLGCKNLYAAIGPCIQKQSFEVEDDIISLVDEKYISEVSGKKYFDMSLMIYDKLLAMGVKNIEQIGIDTVSDENFFSHRRQNGRCGTQFSGILLKRRFL
ncbi:MAG: peptidoglycan editing factor PgeF [Holosporales bacterium]|jgi:YfiH family protein|nr:peptidoglycan editing factor PgeF [Holosporales bacterium]